MFTLSLTWTVWRKIRLTLLVRPDVEMMYHGESPHRLVIGFISIVISARIREARSFNL